jgi:hypothetical protein
MDPNPKKLLIKVVKLFDKLHIPYVLTGGVAVTIWGAPRYTADVDLVVQLRREDIAKLFGGLKKLSEFGYIDEEMIQAAVKRNSEFNYIDTESGFKVDVWIPKDSPFTRTCFDRRVKQKIGEYPVWLVSPEDLIVSKLDWWHRGSMKSQYDVRTVMDGQRKGLDWKYIETWATELGLEAELDIAKSFYEYPPM